MTQSSTTITPATAETPGSCCQANIEGASAAGEINDTLEHGGHDCACCASEIELLVKQSSGIGEYTVLNTVAEDKIQNANGRGCPCKPCGCATKYRPCRC